MKETKLKKVGKYIHNPSPIANGSYSTFFKGFVKDDPNNQFFAIKCIKLPMKKDIESLIENEYKNSEYFNKTKLITEYVDKMKSPKNYYLVYKFFDSQPISEIMKQKPDYNKILKIFELILRSLAELHSFKCIHRNLNPSHILISEDLKSLQFCGRSSIFILDKEYPSGMLGNPIYQAPEEIKSEITHEKYTEKVDIFSIGVIFYELLIGLKGEEMLDVNSVLNHTSIPQEMKIFLSHFLDTDPNKRLNAKDLLKEIPVNKVILPPQVIPSKDIQPVIPPSPSNLSFSMNKKDLSDFKVIDVLGNGNFAKVSLVEKKVGDKVEQFALKEINLSKVKDTKGNELVRGEIKLLEILKNVGFVNKLYDHFEIKKNSFTRNLYMVLEYCNGKSLESYIIPKGSTPKKILKMDELKIIAWNLAEGLNELHKMNIVHRDLKPDNILLITDKLTRKIIDAKICDLGLSRQLAEENPQFVTNCGTTIYKAPELFDPTLLVNAKLDTKVDVYSFGLILYFMIFNRHAKEGKVNYAEDFEYPETPNWCPPDVINLIKKCTSLHHTDRPSMKEVVNHPFFSRLDIPILQMDLTIFDKDNPDYNLNSYSKGFKDTVEGKYWMKLYENLNLGISNNKNEIDKYVQREIDFLMKAQNISHTVKMEKFGKIEGQNSVAIIFEYIENSLTRFVMDRCSYSNGKESYPNISSDELKCAACC